VRSASNQEVSISTHELVRYSYRSRILYHGLGLHVDTVESSMCFHQFVEPHMAMLSQGCRQIIVPDNSVSIQVSETKVLIDMDEVSYPGKPSASTRKTEVALLVVEM
jgi:hypothetical protein